MSCYFRHMKDIFADLGIEVTKENKKQIDAAIHKILKIEYKDCPNAWRSLKESIKDEKGKNRFINRLKKELT